MPPENPMYKHKLCRVAACCRGLLGSSRLEQLAAPSSKLVPWRAGEPRLRVGNPRLAFFFARSHGFSKLTLPRVSVWGPACGGLSARDAPARRWRG